MYMPDKQDTGDNKLQNSTYKADDFDKEKDAAAKEQNKPSSDDEKTKEQEILKQQKETD